MSLRARLLLLLLATVVGSQIALGLLGRRYAQLHLQADARRELVGRLREAVAPVADRLAAVQAGLDLLAVSGGSLAATHGMAEALLRSNPEIDAIVILASHDRGTPVTLVDQSGVHQLSAAPEVADTEGWLRAGAFPGGWTVAARVRPERWAARPRGASPARAQEALMVATPRGVVVWEWPPRAPAGTSSDPGAEAMAAALRAEVAAFAARAADRTALEESQGPAADASAAMMAVERLPHTGCVAGIRWSGPPGAAAAAGFLWSLWGILAITPLLAAWLAYRFSRWISRRIERISDTVHAVAQGDLERTVTDGRGGDDELTELGRAVNAMTASLRSHRSALEAQRLRLAEALREVESLDRLKDSFLALVSHEVRTPLTSILGGIELLNDGSYRTRSADETTLIEIVHDGCKRLASFMNDAILMASLQASRARTGHEEVSVTALVDGQLAELSGAIAQKRLVVHNGVDEHGEIVTWGDWTLLQVAVRKVLDNAVMHNVEGGELHLQIVEQTLEAPAISLQRLQAQRGRSLPRPQMQWRALRVFNTGPVVPADKLRALFQRFELVHDVAHHQRGSGLSLPIAAHVLHQHHGAVEVRQVGQSGMAFYVVLPMRERALATDRREDLPAGIDSLVESALTLGSLRRGESTLAPAWGAAGAEATLAIRGGSPAPADHDAVAEPVLPIR